MKQRNIALTVALVATVAIVLLPFLSATLFNTKGEPREAIVAVSMLQQDNWILPTSCGGDIPYKPPMLAWCVAALSWLFNGGVVSEWTSRLPSALALIVMLTACFRFFARRGSAAVAMLGSLLTLTAFEVYRAGMTCRVDMLNTMFIVLAILALYRWRERQLRGVPLTAVLLMSGAFLTKGPVGVVLPCMVLWVLDVLMSPGRWWRITWRLALCAIGASVVPMIWYVAAYHQGGDTFLALVLEENFGRLTGSMSYDSHVNPAWYNIVTVVSGWLPWTLMLLMSLLSLHYSKPQWRLTGLVGRATARLRAMEGERLLALLATVLIFIFYCIPKSKRSVYLLPIYPFMGYFIAIYIRWLCNNGKRMLKSYAAIIGTLATLAPVLFVIITVTDGPLMGLELPVFTDMRAYQASIWQDATLGISFCLGILTLISLRRESAKVAILRATVSTLGIYLSFGALYSPSVLNARSDRDLAGIVTGIADDEPVYSYASDRLIRFYTVGFYSGDRVRRIDIDNASGVAPDAGVLMVAERDLEQFAAYNDSLDRPYTLRLLHSTTRRSCDLRSPVYLFEFGRMPQTSESPQNVSPTAKTSKKN